MKELDKTIKRNGFTYELLKRDTSRAIYAQYIKTIDYPIGYEIIKIRRNVVSENGTLKSIYLPENAEIYPSTSKWGIDGWTFKTIEQAENKYNEIQER